jgi:hypothetical protein
MELIVENSYKEGLKKILRSYPGILTRLNRLTDEILEMPKCGIGHPEQL